MYLQRIYASTLYIYKLINKVKKQIQGTLVSKLTLGPFLTLSVKNGHTLKDWVLGISAQIQSKIRK